MVDTKISDLVLKSNNSIHQKWNLDTLLMI